MEVRPDVLTTRSATLRGSEGELVSVSIGVDPRLLESLLEALAKAGFPINPQLFHSACVERISADGRVESEPATLVEFPAYASRVAEVRKQVGELGLDAGAVWTRSMLEEMHAGEISQPAPAGSPWVRLIRRRNPAAPC